jgi:hypothetical protein
MWEQYGDVHRDVCLLFDRGSLERAIGEQCSHDRLCMRDVEYTREGIVGARARTFLHERIFEGTKCPEAVADYLDARRDDLFFLKSDDFAPNTSTASCSGRMTTALHT